MTTTLSTVERIAEAYASCARMPQADFDAILAEVTALKGKAARAAWTACGFVGSKVKLAEAFRDRRGGFLRAKLTELANH